MADTPAQVALDEKGLEAATAAYNDLMFGNDADHAEQIVRAYLSSLSGETGALVDYTNLLSVITDIRMKSGVGAKPMLSELADTIGDKLASGRMAGDASHAVREVLDTAGVPSAAFIEDHVRNAISQELVAWRCDECGCHTYALIDQRQPYGSHAPGSDRRCVNCKKVHPAPRSLTEGAPSEAVVERIVTEVMRNHVSPEYDLPIGIGGCPRVDWHQLRKELVAALLAAKSKGGQADG